MHKLSLIFCCIALLFASCSTETRKETTITGKSDLPNQTINFNYIKRNYAHFKTENYSTTTDSLGNFSISIPVEQLTIGTLETKNIETRLVFSPEFNFTLYIKNDSLSFEGKGADENLLMYTKNNTNGCSNNDILRDFYTKQLSMEEMILMANKAKELNDSILSTFQSQKKYQQEFLDYISVVNKVDYIYCLNSIPLCLSRKNRTPITEIKLPKDLQKIISLSAVANDKYVCSNNYLYTLGSIIRSEVSKQYAKDSTINRKDLRWKYITDSLPPLTKEYCVVEAVASKLSYYDFLDSSKVAYFKSINPSKNSINAVNEYIKKYETKKAMLNAPLHSDFLTTTLCDTTGNELHFKEICEKYKNKVLYLDIWSLGCGPCRMAMPFSKQMKDSLKGKDVEFIYLTVDSGDTPEKSKKIWNKTFEVSQTKHNHYCLKASFNAKILQLFSINYVPDYMIIDKKGKLVSYNADRPVKNGKYNSELQKQLIELALQ